MELEAKSQYNFLKDIGVLYEVVEDMTGDWDRDKKVFLQYYKLNQDAL